jgi:hypothetical protein
MSVPTTDQSIQADGVARETLNREDYGKGAELKTFNADLALVLGSATRAEQFIVDKQWNLLWRDADLLYQSPRPMSVYENTYVLEPNVQRFTVAKVVNSIVPQLYKGLFYTDPPMVLRPRPGTSQDVVDAKTALYSYLLNECRFKTETKWGLQQMGTLGTSIWKWGIEYKEVITRKRKATATNIEAGVGQTTTSQSIPLDTAPDITTERRTVPRPFFENRPINKVWVDPKTDVGDIRRADFAIDVRYMDFYKLNDIREALSELPNDHPDKEGWELPESEDKLREWWLTPSSGENTAPILASDNSTYVDGAVHHSEKQNIQVTPDLLFKKMEVLEYWDRNRKIMVIDRKKVIFSGKNPYGVIPFLSANWWNREKAFYGMGLGLIVGQNQRVDQGTINAILKILSFGVNPIYLRKRDTNAPTQMIRTGLGKIFTVDGEIDKSFRLMETPKVPPDIWSALAESEKATESSSGADQALVQGSSAGPRSSMGRTATGASNLAGASASRLDGPLDNFIEQVFEPFLYILDDLVFTHLSDAEIFKILGEEMGNDLELDFQAFHDASMKFEVLAGAALAAKRTMAQSLTLITQIFENPSIQQNLADINEEYIDFKEILSMWMESSEWKNKNDIIKPMTTAMKQRRQQQSQAAQAQSKAATQQQSNDQKFAQKQQLEDQQTQNRIKRDLIVNAFRQNASSEAAEGTPSPTGVEGQEEIPQ